MLGRSWILWVCQQSSVSFCGPFAPDKWRERNTRFHDIFQYFPSTQTHVFGIIVWLIITRLTRFVEQATWSLGLVGR